SRPIVNGAKPSSNVFHKSHFKRNFYQRTALKNSDFKETVNTAKVNNVTTAGTKAVVSDVQGHDENAIKSSAYWIWRPIGNVIDHISKDSGSYMLKRFDYVDPQVKLKTNLAWVTLLEAYLQSFLKMAILVLLVRRESNTKPLARPSL
ncbi:hypothetical protein Tco_0258603, partial [Tanacetum coccineum]